VKVRSGGLHRQPHSETQAYYNLLLLHRRISTLANKYFYKLENNNFFIDQQKYLTMDKTSKNN